MITLKLNVGSVRGGIASELQSVKLLYQFFGSHHSDSFAAYRKNSKTSPVSH